MKSVDIVIPVHGKPKYLTETIQSVINQSFVGNIILVLDRVDKSYFSSLNFNKKRCLIIDSENPGIVAALNLGLQRSKAEFIARIDSDDIMFPNRIGKQLKFLVSNPEYVCVGSSIELFGVGKKNKIKKYPGNHNKIVKHLTYQNSIAHPSVMYRRKSVLRAGGYRAIFEGSEDYDLWFRLSKVGKLYNLKEPLTKYRINADQYSSKFSSYRVELDSIVRLFNLASIKKVPIDFFEKSISGDQIKVYLENFMEQINVNQPKMFDKLEYAKKFGFVLNTKKYKHKSVGRNFTMFTSLLRMMITSPFFSIQIILGKICK